MDDLQGLRHEVRTLLNGMIINSGHELARELPLLRGHIGALANVTEDVWLRNIANFIDTMWQKLLHKSHRRGAEDVVWNILKRAQLVHYNSSGGRWVWNRGVPEAETQNYLSMVLADV